MVEQYGWIFLLQQFTTYFNGSILGFLSFQTSFFFNNWLASLYLKSYLQRAKFMPCILFSLMPWHHVPQWLSSYSVLMLAFVLCGHWKQNSYPQLLHRTSKRGMYFAACGMETDSIVLVKCRPPVERLACSSEPQGRIACLIKSLKQPCQACFSRYLNCLSFMVCKASLWEGVFVWHISLVSWWCKTPATW